MVVLLLGKAVKSKSLKPHSALRNLSNMALCEIECSFIGLGNCEFDNSKKYHYSKLSQWCYKTVCSCQITPKVDGSYCKTVWSVACMPENLFACPIVANLMSIACGGAMDWSVINSLERIQCQFLLTSQWLMFQNRTEVLHWLIS